MKRILYYAWLACIAWLGMPQSAVADDEVFIMPGVVAVHYPSGRETLARNLADAFVVEKTRICYATGFSFSGPTQLILCSDGESFRRKLLEPDADANVAAATYFRENTIVVNLANSIDYFKGDYNAVLAHEIAHLVFHEATKQWGASGEPLWFNEGLACWYGRGEPFYNRALFQQAVNADELLPFETLESEFPSHGDRMSLAYYQSYDFIRFTHLTGGKDALREILQQYSRTGDFARSFQAGTGYTVEEMQYLWKATLRKNHLNWLMWFQDTYLFIALSVAVILGYWLVRRRNQKTLREWREREAEEAGDYYDGM